jgi:hypothetical protein
MTWFSGARRLHLRRRSRILALVGIAALVAVGAAAAVSSRSAVAPMNNSLPTISGTTTAGNTLSANPGTWTGSAPIGFQYQWRLCDASGGACVDIAGATAQTYLLKSTDADHTVRIHVIGSNTDGFDAATSNPSAKIAAAPSGPGNTSPPTISGSPTTGSTLTANPGGWSGATPITFSYRWLTCNDSGDSCNDISGATHQTYLVQSGDTGKTIRVRVTARNSSGATTTLSAATAKITTGTAPPTTSGCPTPAPGASSVPVSGVTAPARLQIANFSKVSGQLTSALTSFSVRFRITDTCGHSVSGASVYATAVPYNMVSIPREATTDASGWVTLTFSRLSGYPATPQQRLLVMFVRARKPGGSVLAGISTRRLISFPVKLNG